MGNRQPSQSLLQRAKTTACKNGLEDLGLEHIEGHLVCLAAATSIVRAVQLPCRLQGDFLARGALLVGVRESTNAEGLPRHQFAHGPQKPHIRPTW
eukprot:jgi/Botrbrau1/6170/Bobra.0344s0011.1